MREGVLLLRPNTTGPNVLSDTDAAAIAHAPAGGQILGDERQPPLPSAIASSSRSLPTRTPLRQKPLTVAEAVEHWLDNRKGEVKPVTLKTYAMIARRCIVGPLVIPDIHVPLGQADAASSPSARLLETLGPLKIADLSTAEIRRWHRMIMTNIGARTASVARTILQRARVVG